MFKKKFEILPKPNLNIVNSTILKEKYSPILISYGNTNIKFSTSTPFELLNKFYNDFKNTNFADEIYILGLKYKKNEIQIGITGTGYVTSNSSSDLNIIKNEVNEESGLNFKNFKIYKKIKRWTFYQPKLLTNGIFNPKTYCKIPDDRNKKVGIILYGSLNTFKHIYNKENMENNIFSINLHKDNINSIVAIPFDYLKILIKPR